jgi:hypothetical protein
MNPRYAVAAFASCVVGLLARATPALAGVPTMSNVIVTSIIGTNN